MINKKEILKFIGEFGGTFIFIFLALHSIYHFQNNILKAFFVGLSLTTGLIFANFFVTGHLNPIKTILFYHSKQITLQEFITYLTYQILGGLCALYAFAKYDAGKKLSEIHF